MRKVKVYSVVSVEGYACGEHGEVDWLLESDIPGGIDYGMNRFYGEIDTVVMTRNFYSTMYTCELCHVFLDRRCIVVKSPLEGEIAARGNFEHIPYDEGFAGALKRVEALRATAGADIWIAGGIRLVNAFFEAGMIDEVYLTILPVSLPRGIRLFPASFNENNWRTETIRDYGNGVVQLHYRSSVGSEDLSIN